MVRWALGVLSAAASVAVMQPIDTSERTCI